MSAINAQSPEAIANCSDGTVIFCEKTKKNVLEPKGNQHRIDC
jgi:hypothetical protein